MDELQEAIQDALTLSGQGTLDKGELIRKVERSLGRLLTPCEAGLGLWEAREAYLEENRAEFRSERGSLSLATLEQSIKRRRGEHQRVFRILERSSKRSAVLAERNDLPEEQRRELLRLKQKTNNMYAHAAAAECKSRRKLPPGLGD